jgi:hypothetical protein
MALHNVERFELDAWLLVTLGSRVPEPPMSSRTKLSVTTTTPAMAATDDKHKVYPPSKLGEYTVVQDIAEGTFGKVKSG